MILRNILTPRCSPGSTRGLILSEMPERKSSTGYVLKPVQQ